MYPDIQAAAHTHPEYTEAAQQQHHQQGHHPHPETPGPTIHLPTGYCAARCHRQPQQHRNQIQPHAAHTPPHAGRCETAYAECRYCQYGSHITLCLLYDTTPVKSRKIDRSRAQLDQWLQLCYIATQHGRFTLHPHGRHAGLQLRTFSATTRIQ